MSDQAEIHRMAQSQELKERSEAADLLKSNFYDLPDAKEAWDDLHKLAQDPDMDVRAKVSQALGFVFSHIPDKKQAWNDLIMLMQDDNAVVKNAAVRSLGMAFSHMEDKERAWKNLHWMVKEARRSAALAIGAAYSHIPDKEMALQDLHRLEQDREKGVRLAAKYSLGRVSLLRAAEAQNKQFFIFELEKAIGLFEESAEYASYFSQARFCLPFYRSFHAIFFNKEEAEAVTRRYLAEMRINLSDLENKEKLLEAAENLAGALKEFQDADDLDEIISEFNTDREYCENAAELLDTRRKVEREW